MRITWTCPPGLWGWDAPGSLLEASANGLQRANSSLPAGRRTTSVAGSRPSNRGWRGERKRWVVLRLALAGGVGLPGAIAVSLEPGGVHGCPGRAAGCPARRAGARHHRIEIPYGPISSGTFPLPLHALEPVVRPGKLGGRLPLVDVSAKVRGGSHEKTGQHDQQMWFLARMRAAWSARAGQTCLASAGSAQTKTPWPKERG